MQITLRKAAKLISKIHATIGTGAHIDVRLKDTDEAIQEQITKAQDELGGTIVGALELVQLKFTLRQRQAEINASSGVSAILTELESLKAQRKVLDDARIGTPRSTVLIFDEIELKREKKTDMYDTPKATARIGVVTQEHVDLIESKLKQIEKSIEDLNDKREALNNTNKITLSEGEVQVLKAADLL
ncbi:coil containing protein [Vibrio phage 2.275.O._10N.286.54.E11]|nr:coil containing protein [Vibrio phage 2.275.O._10N.286.54.E11]